MGDKAGKAFFHKVCENWTDEEIACLIVAGFSLLAGGALFSATDYGKTPLKGMCHSHSPPMQNPAQSQIFQQKWNPRMQSLIPNKLKQYEFSYGSVPHPRCESSSAAKELSKTQTTTKNLATGWSGLFDARRTRAPKHEGQQRRKTPVCG
jgi:hypothetical protein